MYHILTVDDSRTMREMLALTLRSAGFKVSSAQDGAAALALAQTEHFALVITDINMPVLDGIGLIHALRKLPDYRHTPILTLTTEDSPPTARPAGPPAPPAGWSSLSTRTACSRPWGGSCHDLDLTQFQGIFFEESFEGLDAMESALVAAAGPIVDTDVINALFRAAHSMKGGSGTFGYADLTRFTHRMEALLDQVRHGTRSLDETLIGVLLQAVDGARDLLKVPGTGGSQGPGPWPWRRRP